MINCFSFIFCMVKSDYFIEIYVDLVKNNFSTRKRISKWDVNRFYLRIIISESLKIVSPVQIHKFSQKQNHISNVHNICTLILLHKMILKKTLLFERSIPTAHLLLP